VIRPVTLVGEGRAADLHAYVFHAMGTGIEFLFAAEPTLETADLLHAAEGELRRIEALLTRFSPHSELSRLNRDGRLVCGDDLLTVTELALEARERTGGRFDPTVHDAVVGAGYDRTFEELPADRAPDNASTEPCGGKVTVDREERSIELEHGYRLDLGGIAKGYAVDRAADILAGSGPCLVNAGGDIAVRGTPGGPWPVGVETPSGSVTLALEYGALATSGSDRRRWRVAGSDRHHLIDPATSRPSESDILRVTVVAETAVDAEVKAKALFLAGEERAAQEANALGIPCLIVTLDERTVWAGGLA
jgi:thiamine biosynthesis lipoprotein